MAHFRCADTRAGRFPTLQRTLGRVGLEPVRWSPGAPPEVIACEGDALPGGGTLADSDKTLAASGRGVAFPGEDLNGTEAIYAWRAGRFARIATNGEANPAGGGFFVIQEPQVSMKGRTVVFGAGLEGANYSTAAFLALLE